MKATELASALGAELIGDPDVTVTWIASLESAESGDLVFVDSEKHLAAALASPAAAIIAGDFARRAQSPKPLLIVRHPKLAFSRAARHLRRIPKEQGGVHPFAAIDPTAKLGANVSVREFASVSAEVTIGAGTKIGVGCCIGSRVTIGEHCELKANVTVYPGTRIGNRVTVHAGAVLGSDGFGYVRDPDTGRYEAFPQVGRLEIEDDVEIGANTTIDRGALDATVIGRGVKLDNLVHVGHNVSIGADVVIAAQTGISGSSAIEKGAVVAGQVGIADHVRIEAGAILGAQCGVPTGKIIRGRGILFWGTPARPIRQYLKELAALARLARK